MAVVDHLMGSDSLDDGCQESKGHHVSEPAISGSFGSLKPAVDDIQHDVVAQAHTVAMQLAVLYQAACTTIEIVGNGYKWVVVADKGPPVLRSYCNSFLHHPAHSAPWMV